MTFKRILFRLHWLLGLTAGTVLMVTGVTGALLSFEDAILLRINPGVMTVAPGRGVPALAPAEILARLAAERPGRKVRTLTLQGDPERAARVVFTPPPDAAARPGGLAARGEARFLDPYTGTLLGEPCGEAAFHAILETHRWLLAGDAGKQLVGASTAALVVLASSGLYLRWPRRAWNWRIWFSLGLGTRRGRSLFWTLHSVIGTWMLPFYLLAGLTGLYWSYGWYRDALATLAGMPPAPAAGPSEAGGQTGKAGRKADAAGPATAPDLGAAWAAFRREVPAFDRAMLRIPGASGQPLQVVYLTPDPLHDRATSEITVQLDGTVRAHRRHADQPLGQRLYGGILALHNGTWFGLAGQILMMLASLLMPLFGVTGWLLHLGGRRKPGATQG